jgi:hypothetical protein
MQSFNFKCKLLSHENILYELYGNHTQSVIRLYIQNFS